MKLFAKKPFFFLGFACPPLPTRFLNLHPKFLLVAPISILHCGYFLDYFVSDVNNILSGNLDRLRDFPDRRWRSYESHSFAHFFQDHKFNGVRMTSTWGVVKVAQPGA